MSVEIQQAHCFTQYSPLVAVLYFLLITWGRNISDCIKTFFEAWQIEEAEARLAKIDSTVTESVRYDDPSTPETLSGVEALSCYVGMFSTNAPGWSAKVVKSDTVSGVSRVTVAFSGMGPDGSQQVQLGQYFVEKEGDRVSRMVGFVGTGEQN